MQASAPVGNLSHCTVVTLLSAGRFLHLNRNKPRKSLALSGSAGALKRTVLFEKTVFNSRCRVALRVRPPLPHEGDYQHMTTKVFSAENTCRLAKDSWVRPPIAFASEPLLEKRDRETHTARESRWRT